MENQQIRSSAKYNTSAYRDVGMRMIDAKNYVEACKSVWIKSSEIQTILIGIYYLNIFFSKKNCEIFLLSKFATNDLPISIPSFCKEAILSREELRNKQTFLNEEDLTNVYMV